MKLKETLTAYKFTIIILTLFSVFILTILAIDLVSPSFLLKLKENTYNLVTHLFGNKGKMWTFIGIIFTAVGIFTPQMFHIERQKEKEKKFKKNLQLSLEEDLIQNFHNCIYEGHENKFDLQIFRKIKSNLKCIANTELWRKYVAIYSRMKYYNELAKEENKTLSKLSRIKTEILEELLCLWGQEYPKKGSSKKILVNQKNFSDLVNKYLKGEYDDVKDIVDEIAQQLCSDELIETDETIKEVFEPVVQEEKKLKNKLRNLLATSTKTQMGNIQQKVNEENQKIRKQVTDEHDLISMLDHKIFDLFCIKFRKDIREMFLEDGDTIVPKLTSKIKDDTLEIIG